MKTNPTEKNLSPGPGIVTRSSPWRRGAGVALIALASANAVEARELPPTEPGHYVYALVVQADPIIEVVREPVLREVCYDVPRSEKRKSVTPHILGGIIGGVVGNQIGSGSGRTAATIAGALLGTSLGADHARKRRDSHAQRCEVTRDYREHERVAGYRVKYQYDGEIRTAETREDPGEFLKLELRVAVSGTTEQSIAANHRE